MNKMWIYFLEGCGGDWGGISLATTDNICKVPLLQSYYFSKKNFILSFLICGKEVIIFSFSQTA